MENGQVLLIFFRSVSSGPARRMESLLAHVARKERRRLRVVEVDVTERPELVTRFEVGAVPTLVLIKNRCVVERLEGKASALKIERMLEPHLSEKPVWRVTA